MTPAELSNLCGRDVSRETFDRLACAVSILEKWSPRINLVSRASLSEVWPRHIVDSIQVFDLAQSRKGHWVDLGTGGGFPGLIVAILAVEEAPDIRVTLVESDLRKCAFLSAALKESGASATVIAARIEETAPLNADILTARALAPLPKLLEYAARHISASGRAFFPKGATFQMEIDGALASWRFRLQEHPSGTDPRSAILEIEGISRV